MMVHEDAKILVSVLVVEDEHIVALDIQTSLLRSGFGVFGTSQTGENAIRLIEQSSLRPDIVLMDIHLAGEMDGIQTAARLIRDYSLPVIILTAYADQQTISQALTASPYGYLIKPFDIRELKTTITIALLRHRVEQETLRGKELLFSAVEGLPDGIMICDDDDVVVEVNHKFTLIFSENIEDVRGKIGRVFLMDRKLETNGVPSLVKGASENWIEIYQQDLVGDRAGKIYIFRDVSQRITAERDLKQTQQRLQYTAKMEALGRMSEGIAHDFNNFLAIINGHVAVLKQNWDDIVDSNSDTLKIEQIEIVDTSVKGAYAAIQKSGNLIKQLLAFSRNYVTRMAAFQLDVLMEQLEQDLPRLLIGDFIVQVHKGANDSRIYAHYSSIEQVVINLVLNARDAMHSGGRILITSQRVQITKPLETTLDSVPVGDYVVLSVIDNGAGIQKENLEQVFEPFYSTKAGRGSFGLGLSIVYGIVKQSNGFIHVRTDHGKGTAFDIYFPVYLASNLN